LDTVAGHIDMEELYFMIRLNPLLALALFLIALISIAGDGPPPATEVPPPPPPTCAGPPDPAGLIGTDWTESDKEGWIRDQNAAIRRCRDNQSKSANRGQQDASWRQ
jgi:hypothetical protein